MKISIIIPVLNEAKIIDKQLEYLVNCCKGHNTEIIVVDGKSTDNTFELASKHPISTLVSPIPGRANQMNYGASKSSGDVLYFVHIDSTPPESFVDDIKNAVNDGYEIGTYRQKFDINHPLLKINAFMTRYDLPWTRGGDQTFFITKELFMKVDGYNSDFVIMEECSYPKK